MQVHAARNPVHAKRNPGVRNVTQIIRKEYEHEHATRERINRPLAA